MHCAMEENTPIFPSTQRGQCPYQHRLAPNLDLLADIGLILDIRHFEAQQAQHIV